MDCKLCRIFKHRQAKPRKTLITPRRLFAEDSETLRQIVWDRTHPLQRRQNSEGQRLLLRSRGGREHLVNLETLTRDELEALVRECLT